MYLSDAAQYDVIEAFISTSRYLDNLLNIDFFIIKEWLSKFILPHCSKIKLIFLVPRPCS